MQVRCKRQRLNLCKHLKLYSLRSVEASGIFSVAVKCVDIKKNTGGEGDLLGTI